MDYELKYVIAICLIVKIAALSPEFPIGEEKENPEQFQSYNRVGALLLPLPEAQPTYADRQYGRRFSDRGPGERELKTVDVEDVRKIKRNQRFDKCEQKLEFLESSLNWRDIRKTLHWLDRILASNQTELCHRRKNSKFFHRKNVVHFPSSKLKKFFKKKKSTDSELKRRNSKTKIHSKRNKKLKKEKKHKRRSWKNRLREERNKKLTKKEFDLKKLKFPSKTFPLNATILKPNSVLFHVEKMFFQRTKTTNQCEGLKCSEKPTGDSGQPKTRGNDPEKTAKQKPWPHFVYHRVSSNFLHPDSTNQNHKQSAYIAISVVTSSKPDSADNNENT